MDIHEAIYARHSVRSYLDKPIATEMDLGIAMYHFDVGSGGNHFGFQG